MSALLSLAQELKTLMSVSVTAGLFSVYAGVPWLAAQ